MRKKLLMCLLVAITSLPFQGYSEGVNIIPKPQSMTIEKGEFILTKSTTILYSSAELKREAELLLLGLSPATGFDLSIAKGKSSNNSISLVLSKESSMPKEGYILKSSKDGVVVTASTPQGVFNGVQSLLQLLPESIYSKMRVKGESWSIPSVTIEDAPSYEWRGIMLDVSRYFYGKKFVLQFIDMMAMYKMNILHFHLIDDAGWRLEIKKYPKLTEIGGFRGEDQHKTGGFYTQEELKEIVAYAADRNVEVIPEIEIPAHTLAAISAYPWLSCEEKNHKVPTYHFISKDLYCVGKESTFTFLEDVLKETFAIFPSKYIHIGGDEAHYDRWAECPHCQKRKADEGFTEDKELQVYFTNRIQEIATKYNRTIVGWDEILERGVKEKSVGMIWHDNSDKTANATAEGHDVVMALPSRAYFDVAESGTPGEIKAATWLKPISLKQAYDYDPAPDDLDEKYRSQVLGANACLWSDQFIHGTILQELPQLNENRSERYFEYLALPRMAALAEVCWTEKEKRDYESLEDRMASHYTRYLYADWGFRMPEPKLISTTETTKDGKKGYLVELENIVDNGTIIYTTDGSYPTPYIRRVYSKPVFVEQLQNFRAITTTDKENYSLPLYFPVDYSQYREHGALAKRWKPSHIAATGTTEMTVNLTGKIDKNGTYLLTFKTFGESAPIEIQGVTIYKNSKVIAEIDEPRDSSESKPYVIKIDNYETGAGFTLKTKVKTISGDTPNGALFIKREK